MCVRVCVCVCVCVWCVCVCVCVCVCARVRVFERRGDTIFESRNPSRSIIHHVQYRVCCFQFSLSTRATAWTATASTNLPHAMLDSPQLIERQNIASKITCFCYKPASVSTMVLAGSLSSSSKHTQTRHQWLNDVSAWVAAASFRFYDLKKAGAAHAETSSYNQ